MIFATYLILNVTKTNVHSPLLTIYSTENIYLNAWELKFGSHFTFLLIYFCNWFLLRSELFNDDSNHKVLVKICISYIDKIII